VAVETGITTLTAMRVPLNSARQGLDERDCAAFVALYPLIRGMPAWPTIDEITIKCRATARGRRSAARAP